MVQPILSESESPHLIKPSLMMENKPGATFEGPCQTSAKSDKFLSVGYWCIGGPGASQDSVFMCCPLWGVGISRL